MQTTQNMPSSAPTREGLSAPDRRADDLHLRRPGVDTGRGRGADGAGARRV